MKLFTGMGKYKSNTFMLVP